MNISSSLKVDLLNYVTGQASYAAALNIDLVMAVLASK
jgi:hypothetical protein